MTEESFMKTSEESIPTAAGTIRQRKKRKWDQPAESLISAGLSVSGVVPLSNMVTLLGAALPGVAPLSSSHLTTPMSATYMAAPQGLLAPSIQQNVVSAVQKLNQPKIQDELIAREIVINDAEPTVRYKLTKRQTQEEIQRSTGAVVITRGIYHPPNAPNNSEKPLYLHISAGAHLKETAERIIAVDRAAAMVEEMIKQGLHSHPVASPFLLAGSGGGQVTQQLNACVFLGFETDPALNIAARIRGPSDQYINHIMTETGAMVVLRGRGSRNFETPQGEELQEPLHLHLSSNNPKSLEDAKLLAENLLDTISVECAASRVSSSKTYKAVPPPQQLLAEVQSTGNEQKEQNGAVGIPSSSVPSAPMAQSSISTVPGISCVYAQGSIPQNVGVFAYGKPSLTTVSNPQPSISGGTSYNGYCGIYPQATPLQQVALALRQSPSPVTSGISAAASAVSTLSKPILSTVTETGKRPAQRRKFQEQPVIAKDPPKPLQNSLQGSEFLKPGTRFEDSVRNVSTMPPPKKLVQSPSNGMPPPSLKTMPPPPPKFTSSLPLPKANGVSSAKIRSTSDPVPDTLVKLMEYGDDDDEEDPVDDSKIDSKPTAAAAAKPFWAL